VLSGSGGVVGSEQEREKKARDLHLALLQLMLSLSLHQRSGTELSLDKRSKRQEKACLSSSNIQNSLYILLLLHILHTP